ncbi:SDR family NAD(P)-dependent oxidoreductase [Rhodococcus sp. G-MC3]|uniref:SDR family NAD(P)-dependent oxidoreductase n=1 Tax=Rhodococcus sp. G-MC3 TaxID=3046209 RepID=UPI0024BBA337|nr:SDR family NAD(P)-dependent oxidoreductase [Rhodococcus sp. G-MC3]MDJ0396008.1 SDR family NAD(P)-dependent oxidoreductase [Rhodococcus sp. G-MC3]
MTTWTARDVPDVTGKTVVVTGASKGIGLITARELARAGAHVVLAVRNVDAGQKAASEMEGSVTMKQLDVSDLTSIRAFAESWTGPLDVLINNAGVMDIPLTRTGDGLDLQTATNSFGPFLLTELLLPRVRDRVVWVTSQLHRMGKVRLDDLNWETRTYSKLGAYRDSKLHMVLFSLELQRRMDGSGLRSVLAHPGIATTSLVAHSPSNMINRLSWFLNDVEHGALPTLFAATQDVEGNAYVGPDGFGSIKGNPVVRAPSKKGLDTDVAAVLWEAVSRIVSGVGADEIPRYGEDVVS